MNRLPGAMAAKAPSRPSVTARRSASAPTHAMTTSASTAAAAGVERLFALSTHTMQWFIERGFASCALVDLPPRRIAIYNHTRGSKIYMNPLQSARLLDAEELFWQGTLGRPKQGTRSR